MNKCTMTIHCHCPSLDTEGCMRSRVIHKAIGKGERRPRYVFCSSPRDPRVATDSNSSVLWSLVNCPNCRHERERIAQRLVPR